MKTPAFLYNKYFVPAFDDIAEALLHWPIWIKLGTYDFMIQHRRTLIGPFWQTAQQGVWVAGLALVFASKMSEGRGDYIPYVVVGIVLWNFMAAMLNIGTTVFTSNIGLITNISAPLSTHVLRSIVLALWRMLFQFLLFLAILPFFTHVIGPVNLLAIPGFLIGLFTSFWVCMLFAILGARFRDVYYINASMLRFLFFMTPIFWVPTIGGVRGFIAVFNPFTHYLAIVREPLLGNMPSLLSWSVVMTISILGGIVTLMMFSRLRRSIVFWL
ncbi:MAG: ABC transporter permease [Pseudomonadota bacterium]|nr:ABC transporter permease [Pseudomonadota bacterium]